MTRLLRLGVVCLSLFLTGLTVGCSGDRPEGSEEAGIEGMDNIDPDATPEGTDP